MTYIPGTSSVHLSPEALSIIVRYICENDLSIKEMALEMEVRYKVLGNAITHHWAVDRKTHMKIMRFVKRLEHKQREKMP